MNDLFTLFMTRQDFDIQKKMLVYLSFSIPAKGMINNADKKLFERKKEKNV